MEGNNTLLLNDATVMNALQHYFDTVIFKQESSRIVVTGISYVDKGAYDAQGFQVKVCDEAIEKTEGSE